jgi:hypothetical protein
MASSRRASVLVAVTILFGIAAIAVLLSVSGGGDAPPGDAAPSVPGAGPEPVSAPAAGDAAREALPSTAGGAPVAEPVAGPVAEPFGRLVVRVVRAVDGLPVAGARVSAGAAEAVTDDDGRVDLSLAPDRLLVTVAAPDPALLDRSGFMTIRAGATAELTVVLDGTAEIAFCARLVALDDGAGLGGVRLRLHHGSGPDRLESAADGTFLVVASRTQGFVAIESPELEPLRVAVVPGHETIDRALPVPVGPAAELTATVLDSHELPLDGAELGLSLFGHELVRPLGHYRGELLWEARATTDRDGRARFERLPPRVALEVSIRRAGRHLLHGRAPAALEPGANERTWHVARPGSVVGRVVLDDGAPVAGVPVDAVPLADAAAPTPAALPWWELPRERRVVRTGDDGAFALAGLPSGAWLVGVAGETEVPPDGSRFRCAPACVRVDVRPDAVTECTVTTTAGLAIAGLARRPDGAPAAGQVVTARLVGDEFFAHARIDAAGAFRCAPLLPGDYDVSVDVEFEGAFGTLLPVRVRAGRDDVELRLVPSCGSLAGRVVVEDSGVPARAWVTARAVTGSGTVASHCDLDGAFRFVGLKQGLWTVRARDDRGRAALTAPLRIAGGEEHSGVVLALAAGAEIVLRHPPTAGELSFELRRDGIVVYDDPLAEPGAPGVQRLTVAPGRWEVRFLVDGVARHATEVELRAGEERVVVGG